jgi:hypothetical protein
VNKTTKKNIIKYCILRLISYGLTKNRFVNIIYQRTPVVQPIRFLLYRNGPKNILNRLPILGFSTSDTSTTIYFSLSMCLVFFRLQTLFTKKSILMAPRNREKNCKTHTHTHTYCTLNKYLVYTLYELIQCG